MMYKIVERKIDLLITQWRRQTKIIESGQNKLAGLFKIVYYPYLPHKNCSNDVLR